MLHSTKHSCLLLFPLSPEHHSVQLYGKAIHDTKTPADQCHEATRLFNFLHTNDRECNHDILCNMTLPVPFLIQVSNTNMVRVICGIAPYKGDLFSSQPKVPQLHCLCTILILSGVRIVSWLLRMFKLYL